MTDAQAFLLDVAKHALRHLDNQVKGNALNGPHDDILVGRSLTNAIAAVERDEADRVEAERL